MPTLELPQIRIRFKDANYNATVGQTIAGNLVRGSGGKFASGGTNTTAANSGGSTVGKRNEARRYPNIAQLIGTADTASLNSLAHKGAITGEAAQSLFKRGLAELDYTGNFRITAQGRVFLQAAGANNMERAKAALFRAQEIADRRTNLQNKKAQQAAAKLGNKKKRDDAKQQRQQQQAQRKTDLQKKRDDRARQRRVRITTSQQKRDERQQAATRRRAQRNTDLAAKRNARSLERSKREAAKRQREAARAASKKKEIRIHMPPKQPASLAVFKQADGRYRWVTFSSSGFKDNDGETVATKALQEDCDRADQDGNYGELDWWHVEGLELGDCDFNAMSGRILVESGTFRNPLVAEAIKAAAPDLGVSLAFRHPVIYPDGTGTYWKIQRFKRSLMPREVASNRLTGLAVSKGNNDMIETKVKSLFKLLGGNKEAEALVREIVNGAAETEKAAVLEGIAYKAAKPDPEADQAPVETKADGAMVDPAMASDMEPDPNDPNEGMEPGEGYEDTPADNAIDVGMAELETLLGRVVMDAFTTSIAPIKAALEGLGGTRTKETDTLAIALKEVAGVLKTIDNRLSSTEKAVQSLLGDLPKSEIEKRRATNSTTNTEIPERLKEAQPSADPKNGWLDFFFGQEGLVKPN